jgi:hypothetical protein
VPRGLSLTLPQETKKKIEEKSVTSSQPRKIARNAARKFLVDFLIPELNVGTDFTRSGPQVATPRMENVPSDWKISRDANY